MIGRKLCAAGLLFLALLCLAPDASAQNSEPEFTRQMVERFRAAMPGATVEISEPLQIRIRGQGEPSHVNVGRIYNFCATNPPADCEATIAEFVGTVVSGLDNLEAPVAHEQLRVAVRPTEYCDYIDGLRPAGEPGPLTRPFVTGLCAVLMVDYPDRMRSLNAEDLRGLGLEADAAWTLARRQTLADLPRPEALEGLADGIVAVADFDYATSLMLNDEGWRAATATYGDLIVAIPDSMVTIVARRANLADLDGFRRAVREHFDSAQRGITPTLYRWGPNGWAPFE